MTERLTYLCVRVFASIPVGPSVLSSGREEALLLDVVASGDVVVSTVVSAGSLVSGYVAVSTVVSAGSLVSG